MQNKKESIKSFSNVGFKAALKFTTFDGNRIINRRHKNSIANQMAEDLNFFPPITVNKVTSHVIDGQHRLEAFKDLVKSGRIPEDSTISVMYVNCPSDKEKELTINANTHSKNWTLSDYVHSYAKQSDDYARLEEWCKEHPMVFASKYDPMNKSGKGGYRYRFAVAILKGKTTHSTLKDGTFTATEEEFTVGDVVYRELEQIFKLVGSTANPAILERVAVLWHERRKLHTFDEWAKALKKLAKRTSVQKLVKGNAQDWASVMNWASIEIEKASAK